MRRKAEGRVVRERVTGLVILRRCIERIRIERDAI